MSFWKINLHANEDKKQKFDEVAQNWNYSSSTNWCHFLFDKFDKNPNRAV